MVTKEFKLDGKVVIPMKLQNHTGQPKITGIFYVYDDEKASIISKEINIVPGLYKLFDEGIVNCRDHQIRMQQAINSKQANSLPVTNIDIGINDGAEGLVDILVEEKLVSRFYDKDGAVQLCEAGSAITECPKCGFHEGDNCNEV